MSKFNPYDPLPEGLRKSIELSQRLTESIQPILETQERIRAMTRPIEEMAAINRSLSVYAETTRALDGIANANEIARSLSPALEIAAKTYVPIGLSAIQMSNFHIDTSAFQIANTVARSLPPSYMTTLQGVLDTYTPLIDTLPKSPLLDWLQTIDISPLTRIWESWDIDELFKSRYEKLSKIHQQVMYKAKWFPYASTLADDALFDEINEIIYSSRIGEDVSKRCEKRIDKAILSHYTKAEIKRIKKRWNSSKDIEPHLKKALGQTLEAYLRKEYALVIPFLATLWEGIIKAKTQGTAKKQKEQKEDFKKLVDENGYDDVFSDFYNNLIIGTCYSKEDVINGVPNRNGVAHGWYISYPSQKAALNAILLTDFVMNLKPKTNTEDVENG